MMRAQALALLLLAGLCLGSDCNGSVQLEPTLSAIQEDVFFPSCGSFESCHGGSNPQSGLDLQSAEASFAGLVGVEAEDVDGTLVVAGDPDSSILVQSLEGPLGTCGTEACVRQMPVGYALEDYQLEAIRQWILDGAEDN